MSMSVQTNQSALLALQNLNKTNEALSETQSRISTGLSISSAKDNASIWAIAQGQRADIGALGAVKASLNRAASISDVALSAGESISDLLNQIKAKVVAANDTSLDASSRAAMDNDFKALLRQIGNVVRNAQFDGANILDGSLTSDIRFLANADANAYLTLSVKNMTLSGAIVTLASTASINTLASAASALAAVDTSIARVNSALGDLGAQSRQIEAHNTFVSKLSDVLETGLGNLVDADMAREGARLQALQVQQQLGVQSLGIANSAPQVILSLFRSGS
jgi:flagellin